MSGKKQKAEQSNQDVIQDYYDFTSKSYATLSKFIPHRQHAVKALNVQSSDIVLDLACGTGENFKSIAARLGKNGLLVGLDFSQGMIREANIRVRRYQWGNILLLLGDASRLPFADSVFDRVICTYALKVIPPYHQALDEIVRVLKHGGILVVLDEKPLRGIRSFLNPLFKLSGHGAFTDIPRPLIEEMVKRFQDVQVKDYSFGSTFVAVASKN